MSLIATTRNAHGESIAVSDLSLQRISIFAARVIVYSLTAFSVVMLLAVLLTSSVASRFTHIEGFEVTSGSMSPVFDPGAVVLTHKLSLADAQNMEVGDIVTFRSAANSSLLITHRIVEVQNAGTTQVFYTTKGDANQSVDFTHLSASQIVGKYRANIPLIGHLIEGMHRFQIIGLFSVALIFAYISMATNNTTNNNPEEIEK